MKGRDQAIERGDRHEDWLTAIAKLRKGLEDLIG
jgi:hypothetical protein